MKTRIAVLVSGGGTNLQALIDAQGRGEIPSGEIALVISNNPGAYALERAGKAGIETAVCTKPDMEAKILSALKAHRIEMLVLAGFMAILSKDFVSRYPERIINIHPSLIPSFCGTGYYGLGVHEKVLERGARVSGATVHFVDEGTDTGPIILQKPVMVRDDDTAQTLQKRIMQEAEWKLLPMAINLIATGRVKVEDGKAVVSGYDDEILPGLF